MGDAAESTVQASQAQTSSTPSLTADSDKSGIPGSRPAETITALAGAAGIAAAQIFDVEDAAIVSALFAVIGLLPALVTWLVELGRKWDQAPAATADSEAAAELAYGQARLLRLVRITSPDLASETAAVRSIRDAFAEAKPKEPSPQAGSAAEGPAGTSAKAPDEDAGQAVLSRDAGEAPSSRERGKGSK